MIFQLKCFYDLSVKMFLLSFRHESEEASDFSEDVGMTKRARLSPTHSGYCNFRLNKDKKFLNYNNKQTFLKRWF